MCLCTRISVLVTAALFFFFFQAEDGIRDLTVTGVQTCALPIFRPRYGIGDHVEQFLPAGAVALQLLDRRDSLLQDYLLFLEGLDLQLGLLQIDRKSVV